MQGPHLFLQISCGWALIHCVHALQIIGVRKDLAIILSLVTDPIEIGRGELSLAKYSVSGKELVLNPLLKVTIPEAGTRFGLAIFPSPDVTSEVPYRHLLIRTDDLNFKASDL